MYTQGLVEIIEQEMSLLQLSAEGILLILKLNSMIPKEQKVEFCSNNNYLYSVLQGLIIKGWIIHQVIPINDKSTIILYKY